MKKLCLLVALLLCLTVPCLAEENPTTYASGDFRFILLEDGTAEITNYHGSEFDLIIPEKLGEYNVTSIGDLAFYDCDNLGSILIPDNLIHMGSNPFRDCDNLTRFIISPDHPVFATLEGVLFNKVEKTLITFPISSLATDYVVPRGIEHVGDYAFSGNDLLLTVTVPDCVISIGNYAFYSCNALIDVNLTRGQKTIGNNAFDSCYSLVSISLPTSLTSIGSEAFKYCPLLNRIYLSDRLTSIGNDAFKGCNRLNTILVSRDTYAAQYCKDNNLCYTYDLDGEDWLKN